jgi:hypothetical protein
VGFIDTHLLAKADDVGKHDRRQPPLFGMHRDPGVVLHGMDYSAGWASAGAPR